MMKIERRAAPEWLTDNWEKWSEEYQNKLAKNPKYKFQWKQYQKERVNQRILPILKKMTNDHCSFCDGFPMGLTIKETIEHFRPKRQFPLLAYQWENLFLACQFCQEKGDKFDDLLLKPDEINYQFERYFQFNFRTFEIEARRDKNTTQNDSLRAEKTIEIYRLNARRLPQAREREFRKYSAGKNIDDFSFRFMFL